LPWKKRKLQNSKPKITITGGNTMLWIVAAILSAFFAGLTSILAKCGIKKTDSDLATALRTVVVLVFAWVMVFVVGSQGDIAKIEPKPLIFLILSGLATGASWICYFKALSMGDINKVVPIDKSSTVLTVLLAIVCFGETSNLAIKLAATAVLAAGIFLMVEKKRTDGEAKGRAWMLYAALSAVFAALTSILAKVGVSGVESNLGTAIRTGVVLVMAWGIVLARGKQKQLPSLDKKELLFISLSGIATGASWLCYYYAIGHGLVSVVVPIDKLSIVVTVAFSYFVFRERLSKKALLGLCLMVAGTLAMAFFK
jgi:transporter family protein